MKLLNFSIIKLTFCVIIGILIGNFLPLRLSVTLFGFAIVLVLFLIAYIRARTMWLQDVFFGIATHILFIGIGLLTYQLDQPQHNTHHYTNHIEKASDTFIEGKVIDILKPYSKYQNYVIEVISFDKAQSEGKLLLKVEADSLTEPFQIDDNLAFKSTVKEIPQPLNPHQFDYANYMRHQKVLGQVQLPLSDIIYLEGNSTSIYGLAAGIRDYIVNSLEREGFNDDELSIIKALLLGQRDDISKDVYADYAAAGVVHILAVSGLHVGIILAILQLILSPLFRFRFGDYFKIGVIVILLWGFAVLAGLSPSVLRAVTMFSFYAVALNLKRRTSTINVLFLSALILLLIYPELLFQIGFQLSYLSVFSIVMLQPVLSNLIARPRYYIGRLFWGVFTVTIAAQIGVFPLSLFYFHQFPGLFFVTNVLIIPFLGIILSYGIICIILAVLGWLPELIAQGFSTIISIMNAIIKWIATQEHFVLRDIHFSELQVVLTYVLIFTVLISIRSFKPKKIIYILLAALILQNGFIYEKYKTYNTSQFIVFNATAQSVLGIQEHGKLTVKIQEDLPDKPYLIKTITNFSVAENIVSIDYRPLKDVYTVFDKTLLIIDSLGVYNTAFKSDIILLRDSPKLNLNRLIDSLSPKLIIADGSNYKSYVNRWKFTATKRKLPFHHTGEKGAFLIKD